MDKKTRLIIYNILWLVLCSCSENIDSLYPDRAKRGIPVRFSTEWADEPGITRAITDKTGFEEGDVMHVSAVFTLNPETTVGGMTEKTKYATLTWENGEWINKTTEAEFDMDWPWNAVSATFTAYYLENWDGPVTEIGTPLDSVVLDRFEYENKIINPDPIKAESGTVEYGHAVHLAFHHLCTRLTITGVGDEDEYWLRFKSLPGDQRILKNACTMTRDANNQLIFDFVAEESKKVASQVDKSAPGKQSVTFHLVPGDYSTFTLTRRNGYSYITISNVAELDSLKPGNSYTVSLDELAGNIVQDDVDDDWWDEKEPEIIYDKFDIEEFLKAIQACNKDYNCTLEDGTELTLLKKDENKNEMLLMADVDFRYMDFTPVNLPDIATFDGGGHGIHHLAHPLFNNLQGKVTELNLWNVKLDNTQPVHPEANTDTEWGALARVCDGGNINNVRLINAEMNVTIRNASGTDKAYNIGALVGRVQSGKLSRITLLNDISITVNSEYKDTYTTCVGGVIGQCSGMLEDIDNVSTISGKQAEMKVTNRCAGHGTRYTGGIVGLLANGSMDGCEVRTVVDAGAAEGSWNYTGGVAGAARANNKLSAAIADASVAGSVTGGKTVAYNTLDSHSSTGGIVGHVQAATVTGGIAYNKVWISTEYEMPNANTYYTVGGVIGSIVDATDYISRNEGRNAFDTTPYLPHPHYITGTFSGGGGNEEKLKSEKNTADGTGNFVGRQN